MRSFLLASACLLFSGVANANLPPTPMQSQSAMPQSRLASCIDATNEWNYTMEVIRNRVALMLTSRLGPATLYSTRVYQAETPYDLPPLLESANMGGEAEELRQILASLDTERDAICGAR